MEIDYIANVRMPTEKAHGVQIMKMCEAWGAAGHKVALWAPTRFNHIKKDPFDFYSVERNFAIKKILSFDLLPLGSILGKAAFWAQNISFAIFASLTVFLKKSDAIFSRDFWSSYFISLLGRKVIYEIHDSPNRHFITRRAFKKIKKFVVTNNFKAGELMNTFGVQEEKILVAPNGADTRQFDVTESKDDCRRKLNLPSDKKIILYTGHLYGWKGVDILREAGGKFSDKNDLLFVFVGGTSEDAARFASQAGFSESMLCLGHQEYSKMPYFLKAADILVLPNTAKEKISFYETSPIKLFEYMLSGRPVIASDIPSIREIVDEKEVIFFQPDNSDDLKEKIETVIAHYDEYLPYAERAKQKGIIFSWKNRANNILSFISL